MTIFLVGYMGCGKSTVGHQMSRMLGYRFMDMDKLIEQRSGMTIAEIFERHGELYFRRLERGMLGELGAEKDVVIATGGGVPCHGDNMEVMNACAETVYLKMSPEKLFSRLVHGRAKRPLIRDFDDQQLMDYIRTMVEARSPFYERARLVIDCDGVSDEYVARHIANHIKMNSKQNI